MAKAVQPVAVDGIEFDALISSDHAFSADIPEYPVEIGFMVSDTIVIHPETLNMVLFLSDTPITWAGRLGSTKGRALDVIERLKQSYAKRQLVTVVTSENTYENMGITSFTISKSLDAGYAYQIPIAFKTVRVTQTKTVGIPASYGKSGTTGTSAGSAGTSKVPNLGKSDAYNRGYALFAGG
jgi:hypothetical protein